nr:hypothetical protein 143p2_00026 [Serratia proteamaculans]
MCYRGVAGSVTSLGYHHKGPSERRPACPAYFGRAEKPGQPPSASGYRRWRLRRPLSLPCGGCLGGWSRTVYRPGRVMLPVSAFLVMGLCTGLILVLGVRAGCRAAHGAGTPSPPCGRPSHDATTRLQRPQAAPHRANRGAVRPPPLQRRRTVRCRARPASCALFILSGCFSRSKSSRRN